MADKTGVGNTFQPDMLSESVFRGALRPGGLCRRVRFLPEVGSTNTYARALLGETDTDGTAVIAARQTGGRGRRGRQWLSAEGGGLYLSLLLGLDWPLEELQRVTLAAAVAVCRAVGLIAPAVRPRIKWPNDIQLAGRKLCGILCESAQDGAGRRHIIIGIGVNTRAPQEGWGELPAISLEEAAGQAPPRVVLAAHIINELSDLIAAWQAGGFAVVAQAYRPCLPPAGTELTVLDGAGPQAGRLIGLGDDGALEVRMADGTTRRIVSGEVSARYTEDEHV